MTRLVCRELLSGDGPGLATVPWGTRRRSTAFESHVLCGHREPLLLYKFEMGEHCGIGVIQYSATSCSPLLVSPAEPLGPAAALPR